MGRLIGTAIAITAFASTFAFAVLPAPAEPDHLDRHRCGRGSHWIPQHRDRYGQWVLGHCSRRR
jgi:hypothetical protein